MKAWGIITTLLTWLVDKWTTVIMARRSQRNKWEIKDHEHAKDIRDSVRRDLGDELRKHDDAGWRD